MKKIFIKNKSKKKIYITQIILNVLIYMIKIISYKKVCYKKYAKRSMLKVYHS